MELAELDHMIALLMKRASIVIILPMGLFDGTDDHFREAQREKTATNILQVVFLLKTLLQKADIFDKEQI